MDLMTGKPFYHSEWGELFAMLPFDVQDSIASAIWRYVFSNHVLKIPTTIKILEHSSVISNEARRVATPKITFRQRHIDMCHCLNKDGSVCGAQAIHETVSARVDKVDIGQVYDTVDGSSCLPCGITLGMSLGSDNDLQGHFRYMRMPVCKKHHKEADKCGGDVMINKTLAAWGYGNHDGYMIRTDDAPEYNHSFGRPIRVPKMSGRIMTNLDKSKYRVI